jgi:hypothetical protein
MEAAGGGHHKHKHGYVGIGGEQNLVVRIVVLIVFIVTDGRYE